MNLIYNLPLYAATLCVIVCTTVVFITLMCTDCSILRLDWEAALSQLLAPHEADGAALAEAKALWAHFNAGDTVSTLRCNSRVLYRTVQM